MGLAAVAGVVVVALVVVGIVALTGGGNKHSAGPSRPARTEHTLLFALRDGHGSAYGSALLAHDTASGGQGVAALIPSSLVTEVPDRGTSSFGNAFTVGAPVAGETLASTMGVYVDGVWALDLPTFAKLVDEVGGVTVDRVDVDVTADSNGAQTVVVPAGWAAHLNGAQAAALATFKAAGETEASRLARMQQVLAGLLRALPSDPKAVADDIAALPGGSVTTESAGAIAAVLTGLAKDAAADDAQFQVIPLKSIDTGDQQEHDDVDGAALTTFTHQFLAGAIPPSAAAGHNRVLVLNGVGTVGLGESARQRLVAKNLVFVRSTNEPGFAHAHSPSDIVVPDQTDTSMRAAQRVAAALRLPTSDIKVGTQVDFTVADVVVILGDDYKQ